MKQHSKLNSQAEQQQTAEQHAEARALEFTSVEELLRHDALHTPVPPKLVYRLEQSLRHEPPAPRPWWRRLFGRK